MKELWILNDLFVQAAKRGAGTGKKLLEAAKEYALENGAKGVKLQTEIERGIFKKKNFFVMRNSFLFLPKLKSMTITIKRYLFIVKQ